MIKFSLICDQAHEFESWFPDGAAFEAQQARGLVTCPACDSPRVAKAPMAPAIVTRGRGSASPALADEKANALREAMRALRREIEAHTDDVGAAFPTEARAIHSGEAPPRAIRGQASLAEVKSLLEEGVCVAPVPTLPEEAN